jgi:hypothetical protein
VSTVAIVATFAPSESFGGPARIFHMRRVLEAAGHRVVNVVVTSNHPSERLGHDDIVRVVERPFRARVDHIYNDIDLAERAAADPAHGRAITAQLERLGTNVVILEHPFLIDIVQPVVERLGAALVYSCANIEYRLLQELERFAPDWRRRTDRAADVRRREEQATRAASVVTAICSTDQKVLRDEFGVDSVLVPNGTTLADRLPPTAPASGRRAGHPVDFAVAGSAYWPNVEGLAKVAEPSLAFLPPVSRIHVIGSMSNEILRFPSIDRRHSANASRLVLRGFLGMDELIATFHAARAILVPVFTGEGSNLKTADALASGRPVIMTERAARGYEDVLAADDEGVSIVSDATEFRAAMAAELRRPRQPQVGTGRRDLLGWTTRLAPLQSAVQQATGTGAIRT